MMTRANLARRSGTDSLPSCVGGLNDLDSLNSMPRDDALVLTNWFPSTASCDIRGGCMEHATGLPAVVETIMAYNGPTVSKLFAASGTAVYDISTSGAVGAAIATGLGNARWDWVNFGGAAGNFLCAVNGVAVPQFYNGTTWTASGVGFATAITGATASNFSQVNVWKNRLFFVEKNTLKCWYLGVQAIGGAATSIDFSGVAKLGGKLIATATVSSNAGNSQDDFFVAITSEGEMLVYQGTDPASAATFGIVGNFRIGRPIANGSDNQGGRFLCRFGANVVAITADGFVNIQDAINTDVIAQRRIFNDKIVNTISDEVNRYRQNFGWQATLMPHKNRLLINIPAITNTDSHQYVMNTITGAWCRYEGWNLSCMTYWNDNLYGGIGNVVYVMDVDGANDFATVGSTGTPITATVKTSFQFYGGRNAQKHFKMVRPLFYSTGALVPSVNVVTDFRDLTIFGAGDIVLSNASLWNSAIWNTSVWSSEAAYSQNWISVTGIGYSAALKMVVTVNRQTCSWQGWDIVFERGGVI